MGADEIERFIDDQVGREFVACIRIPRAVVFRNLVQALMGLEVGVVEDVLLVIAPEVLGVMVVRQALAEVAVPVIEALPVGLTGRVGSAEPPFAERAGCVAARLEKLSECELFIGDGSLAFGCAALPAAHLGVGADVCVPGVLPGQERAPRRRADG